MLLGLAVKAKNCDDQVAVGVERALFVADGFLVILSKTHVVIHLERLAVAKRWQLTQNHH